MKRTQLLMAIGLMVFSCYAFSRAGLGHVGFQGLRTYGHFGRYHYFELAVWSIILVYYFIKSSIQKLKSPQAPSQERVVDNKLEYQIDLLYQQNEIDMNTTQLKRLFADTYMSLQQAWMKQDLSQANQILSEQLIRDLDKPLNSLKQAQLVDYIRDIEFKQVNLVKINKAKDSLVIRVQLSGLMIDERVSLGKLGGMDKKTFCKKEFTDTMEFSYQPYEGWKAVSLKVN